MDTRRIRVGHAYGEISPNVFSDFDWIQKHWDELLEKYGECIILVFEKKVIGHGKTMKEAAEDAERHLPPEVIEVTPITEFLRHQHPFLRVRPKSVENSK